MDSFVPGKPRGFLLDMGGTILGEFAFDRVKARRHLLEIAHNPRGITMEDYRPISEEFHETVWAKRDETMIEFPVVSFWRLADERLGLTFDMSMEEMELEFWKTAVVMRPEPGIQDFLAELARAGIPVGLVSNTAFRGHVLEWELNQHGLREYFRFAMSSADYGIRKPHPAIFLTAAAKLGIEPKDIWFVGDSVRYDVIGALAAGMQPVWYNPVRRSIEDFAPELANDHILDAPTWRDLATTVGGLL